MFPFKNACFRLKGVLHDDGSHPCVPLGWSCEPPRLAHEYGKAPLREVATPAFTESVKQELGSLLGFPR